MHVQRVPLEHWERTALLAHDQSGMAASFCALEWHALALRTQQAAARLTVQRLLSTAFAEPTPRIYLAANVSAPAPPIENRLFALFAE